MPYTLRFLAHSCSHNGASANMLAPLIDVAAGVTAMEARRRSRRRLAHRARSPVLHGIGVACCRHREIQVPAARGFYDRSSWQGPVLIDKRLAGLRGRLAPSISMTTSPDTAPVAIPMLASGHFRHHASIWRASVVATLKPPFTRGCLPAFLPQSRPQVHRPF